MSSTIRSGRVGREYSVERIRELAYQLRLVLDLQDARRFPVLNVLERHLDQEMNLIRMEIWRDEDVSPNHAMIFRDDLGGDTIVLSESVYEAACSGNSAAIMVVAHELGHWVLHGSIYTYFNSRILDEVYSRCEREADVFAVELMLPSHMIFLSDRPADLADRFGMSSGLATLRLNAMRRVWAKKNGAAPQGRRLRPSLMSG